MTTIRYLCRRQLSEKLGGRSHSSIWRDVKFRRLPPPYKLGGRVYWLEHEVDAAMAAANGREED